MLQQLVQRTARPVPGCTRCRHNAHESPGNRSLGLPAHQFVRRFVYKNQLSKSWANVGGHLL